VILACAAEVIACGSEGSPPGSDGTGAAAGASGSGGGSRGELAGSCDTREVVGPSLGQCREWFGSSGVDLETSCNGLSGAFSSTAPCPPEERVARCALAPLLGVSAVYSYYAPRYTESSARSHCEALEGTTEPR
jgi:hypothetical protein